MSRRLVLTTNQDAAQRSGLSRALISDTVRFAGLLLGHRRALVLATVGSGLLAAIISLLLPPTYTSRATLLPTGKVDRMADLKSLAGLSGPSSQDESSSELFPTILQSRTVADAVLETRYQVADNKDVTSLSLGEYFNLEDPERLRHALAGIVSIDKDKKTGVISLAVETESPELAQQVARQFIQQLDQFNTVKRRSQAGERARYLEQQVLRSADQLRAAEDSLEAFQRVNRNWIGGDDPEVGKIVSRLTREVEIQTQGYGYLRQQLEMARLDAQKDMAVVSVLDEPSVPTVRTSPRRMLMTAFGAVMGLMAMLLWLMVQEFWIRAADKETRQAMSDLKTEISASVRWRRRRARPTAEEAPSSTVAS